MQTQIENTKLLLKIGDITEENVDAIVNAANPTLMGGGGVDGAIHSKGGTVILEECRKIRKTLYPKGLPTGKAVITTGGNLPVKYIIHTVGPICNGFWNEKYEKQLYDAFYNSLKIAKEYNLKMVAFPFISAGVYKCPKEKASKVALKAIFDFIRKKNFPEEIRVVLFSQNDYKIFLNSLKEIIK